MDFRNTIFRLNELEKLHLMAKNRFATILWNSYILFFSKYEFSYFLILQASDNHVYCWFLSRINLDTVDPTFMVGYFKCLFISFQMCMFFLPPTAVIPLHNHPGMTVFSKLLLGTMHITSYDWVDTTISDEATPSNCKQGKIHVCTPMKIDFFFFQFWLTKMQPFAVRLVRRVVDADFTAPCKTCTLYPTAGGNMHTFRAITPCVVLDVLGPPYSKEDDRDCTYYRHHPYFPISGKQCFLYSYRIFYLLLLWVGLSTHAC